MRIKDTIKRMLDDTQYIAALEKQNALLKENLQQEKVNLQKEKENHKQEKANQKLDEEAQYHKRSHSYLRPIDDMQQWLLAHYDFRYNVINTIAIEVQEAGIENVTYTLHLIPIHYILQKFLQQNSLSFKRLREKLKELLFSFLF